MNLDAFCVYLAMKVSSTIGLVSRQGASHMGCRASQVALVVKNHLPMWET